MTTNPPKPNTAPLNWTAAERSLWLAAHNAPKDAVLMTDREMAVMAGQMRQSMVQIAVYQAHLNGVTEALGQYANEEPDPTNGAGAAQFDAERYKIAAMASLPTLERLAQTLGRMAGSRLVRFVVRYDLLELADACRRAAEFITSQNALRRERTPLLDTQKIAAAALAQPGKPAAPVVTG